MLELHDISNTVQQISDVIASVINMDIIIYDNHFRKIGDSDINWKMSNTHLSSHSILMDIISTGKTTILKSKNEINGCLTCPNISKCNLKSIIGVPIIFSNIVIGCIGVIAYTEENKRILIEKQEYFINFINKMADLIVSKLLEKEVTEELKITQERLSSIMNSIDDGIMALDDKGEIVYLNTSIKEMEDIMQIKGNENNVFDIFPQSYIKDLIEDGTSFRNRELNIYKNNREIKLIVSGKHVKLEEKSIGAILTLKKIQDVYNIVNDITLNSTSTEFEDIIGESLELKQVIEKAKKVANGDSTILIQGESGTGKELFARAIHNYSNRKNKPFIAINCAAIPDSLLESELFGFEEGSFTGAKRGGKLGKFQLADGGTIFLDEIGDMSLHLQTKLLRVLQERSIEKIGGQKSIPINVRVIAATNKNLETMVEQKEFREDLFYRLNVIPLFIPPLRQRQGDIKLLIHHFLNIYNKKLLKDIKGFSNQVENTLLNYKWKGNVRELENTIEYGVNMETTNYMLINSIPLRIIHSINNPIDDFNMVSISSMEKKLIENTLKYYGLTVQQKKLAAKTLGISLASLYRKMKEYHIDDV